MYRKLDPGKVIKTLKRLNKRIDERFPQSGLNDVCKELVEVAHQTEKRAEAISKPNIALRIAVWGIIAAGIAALIYILKLLNIAPPPSKIFPFFQGMEAAMNTVFLAGAAIFSLTTLEARIKRRRALKALDELRAIVHVIDMHQLTKDPGVLLGRGPETGSSPKREMNQFELMRYLDYCSEMLSVSGKLAAFYTQNFSDTAVVNAVNELEMLATNLSRKIWQKIMVLELYQSKESSDLQNTTGTNRQKIEGDPAPA